MEINKRMVVVCSVLGVLGLITVILGAIGATSGSQSPEQEDGLLGRYEYCPYQNSPAVGCGIVAALLALTTQIVASAATGCCGCCKKWGMPSETKRVVAVILSSASWIISIIVVILFFMGGIADGDVELTDGKCVPQGRGAFVAATTMFCIALVFQMTSYILLDTKVAAPLAEQQSGIAIGHPVLTPVLTPEAPKDSQQAAANRGDSQQAAANRGPPPSAPPMPSKDTSDATSQV